MKSTSKINERAREFVRATGLTHAELGSRTGWHTHRIWRLLSGRQAFTADDIEILASITGKSIAEFYGEPAPETASNPEAV